MEGAKTDGGQEQEIRGLVAGTIYAASVCVQKVS
jgi:hypothetical protein